MTLNISDLNQWRERRQGSITLGVDATTPITVSQEQLESGTYILGVQGVGKSSLLESIILQQIAQNESVIAIDPHGDLVREIIARMPGNKIDHTYLLDLKEARDYPFGMNLFALPRGQENSRPARDATRNQVIHAFERLWPEVKSGLYFGNVLRPIIATLIEKPELTLAHVPRLFYNDTFRSQYTTGIQNFEAAQFWEEYDSWSRSKRERYCDPLLDRIKRLLSDELVRTILCQRGANIDLGRAISEGKIFLLSLPLRDPAYEFAAPIIGTVFMTLLHGAIFSFGNVPHARRPACTIVIDEFQNFVTEDNEQFFSEGRKYRVKQVLAHQGTHQLDRGDTTMKRTATSAYTIVCFRTNKDDAPDMSSLFAGMKRQPTNIYIDVLPLLETHPSAVVKEFYWHTVTQLQNAAKQREKDGVTLSYDFGVGTVGYKPSHVQETLRLLNDLLYYAQKNQRIDETRLVTYLRSYEMLIGIGAAKTAQQQAARNRQATLEQKIEAHKKERARRENGTQRSIEYYISRMNKLREVRDGLQPRTDRYTTLLDSYDVQKGAPVKQESRDRHLTAKEISIILGSSPLREILAEWLHIPPASFTPTSEKVAAIVYRAINQDALWLHDSEKHTIFTVAFLPKPEQNRVHKLLREKLREKYIDDYDVLNNFHRNEIRAKDSCISENPYENYMQVLSDGLERERQELKRFLSADTTLNRLHADLEAAKREEREAGKANERIERTLRAICEALIQDPIAADKADIPLSEIAEQLKGLPNYTALVKVESHLHRMTTQNLQQTHPAVHYREANERRNRIVSQTKGKYCRGRRVVENEIAQVYQIEPDKQEEKKKDPDITTSQNKKELRSDNTFPVSDKLQSQRKQPSRPTVTVIHPDTGKEVEVLEELFRVVEKVLEKPKERDKTLKQLIERSNRYLAQPGKQLNFYLTPHPLTGEELELDDYEYQQFYQHAQKEGWLQKKSVQDWVQDMDNFFHITREEQTHERHSPPLQGERVSTSQRTAPAHTPEKRRQEPQRRNTSRRRAISDSQWEPPSVFSDEEDDVIQ